MYTTPHVTTGVISASMDDIIQTKPLSIPNTTNKLDLDVNIDAESQYFVTSRKHNHGATEPSAKMMFLTRFSWYLIQCNVKLILILI